MTSTLSTEQLLTLDGVSQRDDSVEFELLDADQNYEGVIHPLRTVSVENATSGSIKRSLGSFVLTPTETADVNQAVARVRPMWVLGNGARLPLGIFLFADASSRRTTLGLWLQGTLVDKGLILDQVIPRSVNFIDGTNVASAIISILVELNISTLGVDTTIAEISSPLAWPAGKSTWAEILTKLCSLAGFYDWYFDNTGLFIARGLDNLESAVPDFNYDDGGTMIRNSLLETNNLLSAPNTFIVIDTSATSSGISAVYDIPDEAPNSKVSRNFAINKVIDAPGIGTVHEAKAYAQSQYQQLTNAFEVVEFDATADPRHDTFDVIGYRGTRYLETSWRLTCAPGGPHHHVLKRVY